MIEQPAFIETLEPRTCCSAAATGTIVGSIFVDRNDNGKFDTFDAQKTHSLRSYVYLDTNRSGQRDAGEPAKKVHLSADLTTFCGFEFDALAAGTYRVAFFTHDGFSSRQAAGYNVTVHGGQTSRRTIPLLPPGFIHGIVFVDRNEDGVRDEHEPIFTSTFRLLYLDLNNNAQIDPGEPISAPKSKLEYHFADVPVGRYILRIKSSGQIYTTPRAYSVNVTPEGSSRKDFGILLK